MKAFLCAVTVLAVAATAPAVTLYDSNGFESMLPGPLPGQDGWTGGGGGGGLVPQVVLAPDPVLGTQAVRLEVPDTQGATSWMDHAIADAVAAGYTEVTVSYDIYRTGTFLQNLWWWWWDSGQPTYGLQWDQGGGQTLPHGWNPGAGSIPTIRDMYVNVTMTWDLANGKAYSWYGGVLVDNGIPISNINSLTGWTIYLGHDAGTGTGASVAWIDNFVITAVPEPASLSLLGLGLLAVRRRR